MFSAVILETLSRVSVAKLKNFQLLIALGFNDTLILCRLPEKGKERRDSRGGVREEQGRKENE